jgi:hypothetical protein
MATQSINQTMKLKTMVPAIMAKNSPRQTPKRSCGRRPTVEAKDEMPDVALLGSVKRELGILGSMNSEELGLLSWSANSDGGL